jgi:hypothetical protein
VANDLTSNPWVVDTASATVIFKHNIKVRHMEYSLYGAQPNQCIVKDQTGKVVWSATGAADLSEVRSGNIGWINGLAVPTLDGGGILRLYFD